MRENAVESQPSAQTHHNIRFQLNAIHSEFDRIDKENTNMWYDPFYFSLFI